MKIYFFILCLLPSIVFAQSNGKSKNDIFNKLAIQGMYQNGYIFATNDFIKGINTETERINAFQTFSIRFSKQTTGKNLWEQLYNYPNLGIGISIYDFHNPEEIGTPIALYGFFNAIHYFLVKGSNMKVEYLVVYGSGIDRLYFDDISGDFDLKRLRFIFSDDR